MILLVAFAISILGLFLLALLIAYSKKRNASNPMNRLLRRNVSEVRPKKISRKTFSQTLYDFVKKIAKPLVDRRFFSGIDLKLKQADIQLAGAEFVIIMLMAVIVAGILAYMLTINYLFAALASLAIPLVAWVVILLRIQNRQTAFTEQLGDCLVTVANALRAGYSFQQAMEVIAKEMEPPISQEFSRTFTDVKMGVSLERALEQMDKRVGSPDFALVVTAVLIQREVGGNLAQILDTISDTIMERIRMKREVHALTAQGRLSAIILVVLPFAMGIFMYFNNPNQFMILFEDPTGQMAIVVAIFMDILGFIVIKRIVDIEI